MSEEDRKPNRREERLARKKAESADNKKKPSKKEKKEQLAQERREATWRAFQKFYEEEYGSERWPRLLEALQKPVRHCIMINPNIRLTNDDDAAQLNEKLASLPDLRQLDFLSIPCYTSSSVFPRPEKLPRSNLTDYYILDAASVLATQALDIQPGDRVLDLCAAPGGKSLTILHQGASSLTANELSPDRRRRLRQVMESYIPPSVFQDTVTVTGKDGTKWYQEPEQYDKVLLDAPCSSERHLLHDPQEFQDWTRKRADNNATRQLALLKAAVHSVCVGGLVVYATCSISSTENDKVIAKYLSKGKIPVQVVRRTWPIGERTKYGWIVLPDKADGWGPLFFAILQRTGVSKREEEQEEEEES